MGVMVVLLLLMVSPAVTPVHGHGSHGVVRTPGPPTQVAFYEVPKCPICARINTWLDELEREHPRVASVESLSVAAPEAKERMLAHGVEHHGVATIDAEGSVVWVEQGHVLTRAALRQKFRNAAVSDRVLRRRGIACGSCIYKMPGVKGCVAAVRMDGKPLLVSGTEVAAHAAGLCASPNVAQVAGHVESDTFVETMVKVD